MALSLLLVCKNFIGTFYLQNTLNFSEIGTSVSPFQKLAATNHLCAKSSNHKFESHSIYDYLKVKKGIFLVQLKKYECSSR